jgi:polysaccharide pyruvyl transferase WcaK-like protein
MILQSNNSIAMGAEFVDKVEEKTFFIVIVAVLVFQFFQKPNINVWRMQ